MKIWSPVHSPQLPGSSPRPLLKDQASGKVFDPVDGSNASIYVCGITPYDSTHMGHAATYVNFDLLKRVWLDAGLTVNHVQNVTDIDDPLFERAEKIGVPWDEIARRECARFADDMVSLRVMPPNHYASISEQFENIVNAIEDLQANGSAYFVDNDIYFDITQKNRVGRVSHFNEDEMKHLFAARGGDPTRLGKRNPLDPLLWKSVDGELGFNSALGRGRPGWHIECVAIAKEFSTLPLSVKAGGSDLIFPHHDMCQAECYEWQGTELANAYLYAGMVYYQGHKMSKSLGNLVFISDLLAKGIDPMAIRLSILSNHYSAEWHWSDELLLQANNRLSIWREALAFELTASSSGLLEAVRTALSNDLDSPAALKLIDVWAAETLAGKGTEFAGAGLVSRMLDKIFGIAV